MFNIKVDVTMDVYGRGDRIKENENIVIFFSKNFVIEKIFSS